MVDGGFWLSILQLSNSVPGYCSVLEIKCHIKAHGVFNLLIGLISFAHEYHRRPLSDFKVFWSEGFQNILPWEKRWFFRKQQTNGNRANYMNTKEFPCYRGKWGRETEDFPSWSTLLRILVWLIFPTLQFLRFRGDDLLLRIQTFSEAVPHGLRWGTAPHGGKKKEVR